jgi:hypothetical protein
MDFSFFTQLLKATEKPEVSAMNSLTPSEPAETSQDPVDMLEVAYNRFAEKREEYKAIKAKMDNAKVKAMEFEAEIIEISGRIGEAIRSEVESSERAISKGVQRQEVLKELATEYLKYAEELEIQMMEVELEAGVLAKNYFASHENIVSEVSSRLLERLISNHGQELFLVVKIMAHSLRKKVYENNNIFGHDITTTDAALHKLSEIISDGIKGYRLPDEYMAITRPVDIGQIKIHSPGSARRIRHEIETKKLEYSRRYTKTA